MENQKAKLQNRKKKTGSKKKARKNETQKATKMGKTWVEKNKSKKKGKKENKRKSNGKTLETQPLYVFFTFKSHENKQLRRT